MVALRLRLLKLPQMLQRRNLVICLGLALLTLAAFWPVLQYGFVNYDDMVYVTENDHVQGGLTVQGVWWAFTNIQAAFWHPLTWLSHMLDWQLYQGWAGGHHLTNLLFHVANSLLLFLVFKRMTGALWRSAFVAALFALHPLHVESVAWVAERKDVLSTFFWMLTMWAYVRWVQVQSLKSKVQSRGEEVQGPKSNVQSHGTRNTQHVSRFTFHDSRFYLLAIFFFALGLMSKPMLVTLPFVLLLLDYWPLRRFDLKTLDFRLKTLLPLLLEKLPFFALTVGACVLAYWTEHRVGAIPTFASIPLVFRVANAILSYASYIRKMLWPSDLAAFYPYIQSFRIWQVTLLGLLLAAATLVLARQRRRYLTVGWLWYVGTLVPVIGLVQVGQHGMADRYTYIPLIGLFVMLAWGVPEAVSRWPFRRAALGLGAAAALTGCIIVTTIQLRYWQDDFKLFEHALAVTERNPVTHGHIAWRLMSGGKTNEALQHYERALQIDPAIEGIHYALGNWHRREGRLDEARREYLAELELHPRGALVKNNLGLVFTAQGKDDEAMACFKAALEINPDCLDAHNNLANMLAAKGKLDEALAHYLAALRLLPRHSETHLELPWLLHFNLGRLLAQQSKPDEAAEHFAAVLRLKPNDPKVQNRLGLALVKLGKLDEAVALYQKALENNPTFGEARNNLGIVLARQGKLDEAVACFRRALQDGAEPAEAHKNLGMVLAAQAKVPEAVAHYRETLRLKPDLPDALNNLAWLLATHKEASVRNGAEAVQLAERAMHLAPKDDVPTLDTLAAAYAEAGRFADAAKTAQQAQALAQSAGNTNLASELGERLKLYQSQHPYRE